jgi:hypothetical protein
LTATEGDFQLPWLVVQYPAHLKIEVPVWRGRLGPESAVQLTESPVRQELVRRLAQGQTAVWLLLETGDPHVDNEVTKRLEEQLKKLQRELKLPQLTDSPEDAILASLRLQVEFSVLRVPRSDAERPLVEMLVRSESDLAERSDPMVFPVFGRGRALFPLVGAGITDENIKESAAFLVGPCSCQIKELNPGFDLLLAADWNSLLAMDQTQLTASAPIQTALPDQPVLVPIPSGSAPGLAAAVSGHPSTNPVETQATNQGIQFGTVLSGIILAAVVAAITCMAVVQMNRGRTRAPRST